MKRTGRVGPTGDGGAKRAHGASRAPKIIKERSRKIGLPPGTLVHIGEKSDREIRIRVLDYGRDRCEEKEIKGLQECFYFADTQVMSWIDVEGLHEVELIQQLGDCQGFNPLMLEDIVNTDQRPKLEDFDDYLYIVIKMLHELDNGGIAVEQVSLVVGANFVISFQEGLEGDAFGQVRERIRGGKGKIRTMGADFLAYALIDAVVDGYFGVLERVGERIEVLEEEVVAAPSPETVRRIHRLKREIIVLRKALWPLREVIGALERRESPLISEPVTIYLRDVYDHTIQAIDAVEAYRDLLAGLLDVYLSSLSNRMNEIMKFLTIIGTIFLPLTFIAGVYGMNFRNMPELNWQWGYFASLLLMVAVSLVMLLYFKRKKWL
ncbi:MAG: magnesium/cobalt transporter CorA [Geobacteraceae bacterium]|nr:magnesium/cobalt transporter CorA [Geobacteraceae bacterium]